LAAGSFVMALLILDKNKSILVEKRGIFRLDE
jgi:hypothetical protein